MVEQHQGEFEASELNQLSGLLRLSSGRNNLVPKSVVQEDLDRYLEPDVTDQRLFVGKVAFNGFFDKPEVVGFATMHPEANGHHIDRLFVHPIARGRGVGRQLMEACIDAGQTRAFVTYDHVPDSDAERRILADLNFSPDPSGRLRLDLTR